MEAWQTAVALGSWCWCPGDGGSLAHDPPHAAPHPCRVQVDGVWQTWIDYDKFTKLATSGEPFGALDYCAPTPEWAVYHEGNVDGGFDPAETRFVRKGGATTVTGGGC